MTFRILVTAAVTAMLTVSGAGAALAKSENAKGGKSSSAAAGPAMTGAAAAVAAAAGAALAGALLSDHDRATITRYFQQHPQPGSDLPPGIAKNLARGKPLPPGIAKRGVPSALTSQLSIPSGYLLQTVGADVVLVAAATSVIADILRDVARK